MFENIRFMRAYPFLDLKSDELPRRTGHSEVLRDKDELRDIDFYIRGKVLAMESVPMRPESRLHYLYLQNFSYMITDSSYYSRQTNYHSYQLLYTYSGTAEMTYMDKTWQLIPGSLFFCDCTKPRAIRCTSDSWESSDLHFHGGNSDLFFRDYFEQRPPIFTIPNQALFQNKLETVLKYHSGISMHHEWQVSSALEDLLLFILSVDESYSHNIPDYIQYLIVYIQNNYSRPLTVDELVEFVGLSKYHLSRQFRKYTGYSPYAYITETRLEHAKSMLINTSLPASKIAILSGFSDEVNFAKLFKQKTNLTPGEFRNGRAPVL